MSNDGLHIVIFNLFTKVWPLLRKKDFTKLFIQTGCSEGWYGENCTERCVGHCQYGKTCNKVTGQCDSGCKSGWTGYMCDKGDINTVAWFLCFDLLIDKVLPRPITFT